MVLFGHIGITLGAAVLWKRLAAGLRLSANSSSTPPQARTHWSEPVDWRLVILGSMLPDIIDKPLGIYIIPNIDNGRIFCHTMLFTLILLVLGLYFYWHRPRKIAVLVLGLGSAAHLILDLMWRETTTLFWPLKGWKFPKEDLTNWTSDVITRLMTNPVLYVPEILGAVFTLCFLVYLLRNHSVLEFIKTGRIAPGS